ncbi:MAG: hypothetical protein PsegKO_00890 [Pseudohongiellaceae bacterium]
MAANMVEKKKRTDAWLTTTKKGEKGHNVALFLGSVADFRKITRAVYIAI